MRNLQGLKSLILIHLCREIATVDVKAVADTFLVSVDVRGLRPTACVGDWKEHGLSGRSG